MRVGLVLPIADEDGADGVAPSYAEIRDLALAAEAGGLDSLWVFDHLLFRFDGATTGHPRVLDDPVGHRRGDVAGPARLDRHVHELPQPGPARQDGGDPGPRQ